MNEIIEKLFAGEPISAEEIETILPNYIILKETYGALAHEYWMSLPMSQRKAFDTVIHALRDAFEIELKQAYANGFKTGAKLMIEIHSEHKEEAN